MARKRHRSYEAKEIFVNFCPLRITRGHPFNSELHNQVGEDGKASKVTVGKKSSEMLAGCVEENAFSFEDMKLPDTPRISMTEGIREHLESASRFTGRNSARAFLTGVCFDCKDKAIVSTDGIALYKADCGEIGCLGDIMPIVPVGALPFLKVAAWFTFSDGKTWLDIEGFTARLDNIDGTFPNWKRVVPSGTPSFCLDFAEIIDMMSSSAEDIEKKGSVKWADGRVVSLCSDYEAEIGTCAEGLELKMSSDYLLRLKKEKPKTMEIIDRHRAVTFRGAEGEFWLVMPLIVGTV